MPLVSSEHRARDLSHAKTNSITEPPQASIEAQ